MLCIDSWTEPRLHQRLEILRCLFQASLDSAQSREATVSVFLCVCVIHEIVDIAREIEGAFLVYGRKVDHHLQPVGLGAVGERIAAIAPTYTPRTTSGV